MISSSPLIPTATTLLHSSPSKSSMFQFSSSSSSSSRLRLLCRGASLSTEVNFVLHDALNSSGIDTTNAREARKRFSNEIQNLSDIERETSISINTCVDLGKTALYIAAEDHALISNSSLPFPVDDFIEILDDLSMDYCSSHSSSFNSSPENFLDSLDTYLYVKKGFRRTTSTNRLETGALYLHSVLTYRSGSPVMLSLIYSEILKMLRLWGLLDFDCEIFFPRDLHALPRGYNKQKSKVSYQSHIITSQTLLVETLRNLKEAFWPFHYDTGKSLFLRAAQAASCIDRSKNLEDSSLQFSPAEVAQETSHHAVQTSAHFGNMKLALSACERLIILETDPKELRDYGILLYHCGFCEKSWQYLKLYQDRKSLQKQSSCKFNSLEEDAVENLMVRLSLISMEKGWSNSLNA